MCHGEEAGGQPTAKSIVATFVWKGKKLNYCKVCFIE